MDKRFLLAVFAVFLIAATVLAAPSVTVNAPIQNQTLISSSAFRLDFNLVDENNAVHDCNSNIRVFWRYATEPVTSHRLLTSDANIEDGTTVVCADYNFVTTTNCYIDYTGLINPTNVIATKYIVDVNMGRCADGTTYNGSSGVFNVVVPVPSSTCSMLAVALFVIAAAMAIGIVIGWAKGKFDIMQGAMLGVTTIIILIVAWTMMAFTYCAL